MSAVKGWEHASKLPTADGRVRFFQERPPVVYCPFCGVEMAPIRNGYHFPEPYLFQHWEMGEANLESEFTTADDFCPNNAAIFRVEDDGMTVSLI